MNREDICIYAVGDIHGRIDLLQKMQAMILADARAEGTDRKLLIFLGDYIDRGPSSLEVLDFLIDNEKSNQALGFESIFLKGNHEDYFMRFLANGDLGKAWLNNGGAALLRNFDLEISAKSSDEEFLETAILLRRLLSPRLRQFLTGLRTHYDNGHYFFVHAGIRPGIALDQQSVRDMLWIRREFTKSKADHGKIIVHGHTIVEEPEVHSNRIGIDTGAYLSDHLTCAVIKKEQVRFLQT